MNPFKDKITYWSNYWSNPNNELRYRTASLKNASYRPQYKIKPEWIKAIIMTETEGRPNLLGDRLQGGSYGLMQILLPTARKYYNFTGDPKSLFDIDTNLYWGIKEFAIQLHHYKNVKSAVLAYNTGKGKETKKGLQYYNKWKNYYDKIVSV